MPNRQEKNTTPDLHAVHLRASDTLKSTGTNKQLKDRAEGIMTEKCVLVWAIVEEWGKRWFSCVCVCV